MDKIQDKCESIIEHKGVFNYKTGGFLYTQCQLKAKYEVKFNDGVKKILVEKRLCGKHFRALQKNSERMKNKIDFDNKLRFREI